MVPVGRRAAAVRIVERCEACAPRRAELRRGLAGEELVPGALGGVPVRDVSGGREVPRLRVAVALVTDIGGAVNVGHDRHRTRVRVGRGREGRARIATSDAARRIRPVQRRVDGQEMGQEVPAVVDERVDPLHPHRTVEERLDRQRRGVVHEQTSAGLGGDRAVSPHRRAWQPLRQYLLGELLHRDLVVVDRLCRPAGRGCPLAASPAESTSASRTWAPNPGRATRWRSRSPSIGSANDRPPARPTKNNPAPAPPTRRKSRRENRVVRMTLPSIPCAARHRTRSV